jgi:hypothetical protein
MTDLQTSTPINPTPGSPTQPIPENGSKASKSVSRWSITGTVLTLAGLVVFLTGIRPGIIGMDRSPVIGFVQIGVFLVGLALICLGGFISLRRLWIKQKLSIAADFGTRLVASGLLFAIFSGMADMLGFGSHRLSTIPFFGPLQSLGVLIGEILIGIGFILMMNFHSTPHADADPLHRGIDHSIK